MNHPSEQMITRYVLGQTSDDEQLQVDAHVTDCSDCLERIRALLYLRDNFDSMWASWSAKEHGLVHRQWKLAVALENVANSMPAIADRVKALLGRLLTEGVGFDVAILLERAKKLCTVAAGFVPRGCEFALQPAVVGVGAPDREAQEHMKKSTELLSGGQIDAAVHELEKAASTDARLPQAAVSEVRREGMMRAQLIVDSWRGRVAVKVWPGENVSQPELALLLPKGKPEEASAREFEPVEDETYLLAEFNNVTSGEFDVIW